MRYETLNPCFIDPYTHVINPLVFIYRYTENDNMCAICLCPIEREYILPACGHGFHYDCITPWAKKNNSTCPLCRTPIEKSHSKKKTLLYIRRNIAPKRICEVLNTQYPVFKCGKKASPLPPSLPPSRVSTLQHSRTCSGKDQSEREHTHKHTQRSNKDRQEPATPNERDRRNW